MAGNPNNWWSMRSSSSSSSSHQQPSALLSPTPSLLPSPYVLAGSSNSLPLDSMGDNNQDYFPHHQSWSQLLMGGLTGGGDDYRYGMSHYPQKKLENWVESESNINLNQSMMRFPVVDVIKQELSQNSGLFCGQNIDEEFQQALRPNWSSPTSSQVISAVSSSPPRSCVTTTTSSSSTTTANILNFSNKRPDAANQQYPDHSSESNSTGSGGISKKARVQAPTRQPPLKVRKEKLGDRITALHQLVSPFGKTDTASVLLEAIGYIRFLQGQIEALSSPYLGNGPANITSHHSDSQERPKDLRSRGLCLVPISCTLQVGTDINGGDYWAPSFGGGF